jgi:hypothetical protein
MTLERRKLDNSMITKTDTCFKALKGT